MALNAADVILVILCVVAFVLIMAGSVYFIVYFQHPDDKVRAALARCNGHTP
jgi:flagellar basal body-associated protein FliL